MLEEVKTLGKAIKGGLIAVVAYLATLNYEMVFYWLIFAMVDTALGVLNSFKEGEFKSRRMRDGLIDKVTILLVLIALTFAQRVAEMSGLPILPFTTIMAAFSFMELTSIIETAIKGGINIPERVSGWFKIAKEQIEKGDTDGQDR